MTLILHSTTLTHGGVQLQTLLQKFVDQGKIKAGTKWKTVYLFVKDDERHTNVLCSPDISFLGLFWDDVMN